MQIQKKKKLRKMQQQKTREKIKINGKYFHIQVDTGYDITLIPVNVWQDLGKPRLKKSTLQLKQFNGTIIKNIRHLQRYV